MKTKKMFHALCFAAALACAPALATNQGSVFDMADQFDRVDKQDFQQRSPDATQ